MEITVLLLTLTLCGTTWGLFRLCGRLDLVDLLDALVLAAMTPLAVVIWR